MNKYITQLITPIIYSCFISSCEQQPKTYKEGTIYEKTDGYVKKMMDSLDIVGLNYCVLLDGNLMHKKAMGFANSEHKFSMTQDKLFAVASMSKLFSSTTLQRLLKDNNRSVDETIGEFLPFRKDLPETWRILTLKSLLSHNSGIPDQIDYEIYLAPESE